MYKGNLRAIVLKALSHQDMSGYNLMKFLEEHTGKKPSSGSIYPLLEELHKKKTVSVKEKGRSKIYSLTKKGLDEIKVSLKDSGALHKKMYQSMKLFSTLFEDKELSQIKEMFEMIIKDKKRAMTFKQEMWPLKTQLFNILKENRPENITKAKKILIETTKKLKQLN